MSTKVLQKRKKSSKLRNVGARHHRTDYTMELFGDYSVQDLKFLHKPPIKLQIQKLKQLLKWDNLDDETMQNILPDSDSMHVEDAIKTEIFSSGIKAFDEMFKTGGIVAGKIMEICGKPNCGKSLLISTVITNILKEHEDIQVIYFDSKVEFKINRFLELLTSHGMKNEDAIKIADRVSVVKIDHMFDLLHSLQELFDPRKVCHVYKKKIDMSKVRFIVINTITIPFYHVSSPIAVSKKITSDLHKTIHRLSKYYGITFFIANLALHKYKISESDKGDDVSSVGSTRSARDLDPMDDLKAALDEYWPEILDHRFVITSINSYINDVLGNVEIPRQITLIESRHERVGKSIIVKITDLGIV